MKQKFWVYVCLGITLFLWASSFVAIKVTLVDYSPVALSVYRYLVASVVLILISIFVRIQLPEKRDIFRFFMLGFIGIATYNVALNYGEQTVSAGATSFIINTVPMITLILSVLFLKEKVTAKEVISMLISFLGIGIITVGEQTELIFNKGVLLIFVAACSQSLFFILQKPVLVRYSSLSLICWSVWLGTLCMLPFLRSSFYAPFEASIESNISLVYLGVFPGALGYLIWTYVLSKMKVHQATSFLYLIPVISVGIAIFWIKELPNRYTIIGGIIAIIGVILFTLKKRK